ncbi:MAG: hypothetical protein ACYCYM_09500 [Saccharofermentanales bacterium]
MKRGKKIVSVLLTFVLILSAVSAISAATEVFFSINPTATYADGGYYVKGGGDSLAAYGTEGLTQTGDMRCLWAFTNETITANPYLKIKLGADTSGLVKITISKNWDVEPEIELTLEASGETVFNLEDMLSAQSTVGYSYVVVYVDGSADFDYIKLSDTGAAVSEPNPTEVPDASSEPSPSTGDSSTLVILLASMTALATLVVTSKKVIKVR